jgi:17beta-estradiol 17-dehydrogenase / very-long-chain 3-oxoacyl-CoA reductase
MSKLKDVEIELKKINPKIQTRIVQADFTGNANDAFYTQLYNKLKDLDISILINNAGVMTNGAFDQVDIKQSADMLDVNVTQVIMMTKKFIQQMIDRKGKSAIINVSSTMGYEPYAGSSIYAATKACVNYFT